MDVDVDCIVIGAGVVGLAIARSMSLHGLEVAVLEREAITGSGISSRNSEVIHAGIYYPRGSIKARLCVNGRDMLYRYCLAKSISHRRIGKLIVATNTSDFDKLEHHRNSAHAAGVELAFLNKHQVYEKEPEIVSEGALWSPDTGIVDSHELMMNLEADIEGHGGAIVCRSEVERVECVASNFRVHSKDGSIVSRYCINSAGLDAQSLASQIAGLSRQTIPSAHFAIGHYYSLSGKSPFDHLIYPTAEVGGLGIHVTLDMAGKARFGPDVRWLDSISYTFDDSKRGDFLDAISRYYPGISERQLVPAYVGIRPKIVSRGEPDADFRISGPDEHGIDGLVNLFGIESPGLTSALAIAEYVKSKIVPA